MSSAESQTPSPPAPDAAALTPETAGVVVSGSRIWRCALWAAGVAGLVAWGIGEATYEFFPPALVGGQLGEATIKVATPETRSLAEMKNASLACAILGGVLGLGLGTAGGVARRRALWALVAGALGLVLAAAAGGGVAAPLLFRYHAHRIQISTDDIRVAMPLHAAMWCPLGAVAGIAFGLGLGGPKRMLRGLLGGLLGAAVGTVAFDLAGAVLFPLAETAKPLSTSAESRFLARILVALGTALGAAWVAGPGRPHAAAEPP